MAYGQMIRKWREVRRYTVRKLAEKVGCTDSYISHLENGVRSPSLKFCMMLARALELLPGEQQDLLEAVEASRRQRAEKLLRGRGGVRGSWQTHSTRAVPPAPDTSVEDLARELAADAELQAAYRNLRTALADPQMREAVLVVLQTFARVVYTDK